MQGVYIHIPFCHTKCIYCDFYSVTNHTLIKEYIDALRKEIKSSSLNLKNRKFDTIYFGGGTPSLLDYEDYSLIFDTLYSELNISCNPEITLEANPGTFDKNKFNEFKKLPFNRISFGVQSFIDNDLQFLTRIHTSAEAERTVKMAQDAGYNNISIDLIFALPLQTLKDWMYNLKKAVSMDIQHVSAYSLIYEENTRLMSMKEKGIVIPLDEETETEMYLNTIEFMQANGFKQYEVSNFAKDGFECKHNLQYWNHEEYIGYGPSAASFIDNKRWLNVRSLDEYIKRVNLCRTIYDNIEYIDRGKSIYEHIFLGLRSRGIDFQSFKNIYNIDFETSYENQINLLVSNHFAILNGNFLKLTAKGYAVCDEILSTYF